MLDPFKSISLKFILILCRGWRKLELLGGGEGIERKTLLFSKQNLASSIIRQARKASTAVRDIMFEYIERKN